MVGGRTVKWLHQVKLSRTESTNPHHLHDNKVLPPEVRNPAQATPYWKIPDYTLYELNINSAILTPAHWEEVAVESSADAYTLKGYAYSGGGRKVKQPR